LSQRQNRPRQSNPRVVGVRRRGAPPRRPPSDRNRQLRWLQLQSHPGGEEPGGCSGGGDQEACRPTPADFRPAPASGTTIERGLFGFYHPQLARQAVWSRSRSSSTLIAAITTRTELEVYAQLDQCTYPDKVKVSGVGLAAVSVHGAPFHPEWNKKSSPAHRCQRGRGKVRTTGRPGQE